MFRKSSNTGIWLCFCCDSECCSTLNVSNLEFLFAKLSLNHFNDDIMASQFSSRPFEGTPAPSSLRNSEIEFDSSPFFHRIRKALLVPSYLRRFIPPTLPEDDQLPMEPLNWEFGVRVNRPFEGFRSHQPSLPTRPPSRPVQRICSGGVRAEDTLAQPDFWGMPTPIVDPYNQQAPHEEKVSGPLKLWFESILPFLVALWHLWTTLAFALWEALKAANPFVVLDVKGLVRRITLERAISLLLAMQLVRIFPGMEGNVEAGVKTEVMREVAPLYVLMIPITRLTTTSDSG